MPTLLDLAPPAYWTKVHCGVWLPSNPALSIGMRTSAVPTSLSPNDGHVARAGAGPAPDLAVQRRPEIEEAEVAPPVAEAVLDRVRAARRVGVRDGSPGGADRGQFGT